MMLLHQGHIDKDADIVCQKKIRMAYNQVPGEFELEVENNNTMGTLNGPGTITWVSADAKLRTLFEVPA